MLFRNTVEFTHVALGLVPKILNPVDVILLVCKEFGMVDPKVMEIRYVQHVVATPTVRIGHHHPWLHPPLPANYKSNCFF